MENYLLALIYIIMACIISKKQYEVEWERVDAIFAFFLWPIFLLVYAIKVLFFKEWK